ncbi:hypothetical protein N7471_013654 [Penicillium samsonianum]|nr:hypothetical protein N7471_013654 [Penicillium samsonianum]
MRERWKS